MDLCWPATSTCLHFTKGHVNKSWTLVAAHRKYSLLDMINLNSHPAGCCPAAAQNLLNISMNTETFVRKYTSSLHIPYFYPPPCRRWQVGGIGTETLCCRFVLHSGTLWLPASYFNTFHATAADVNGSICIHNAVVVIAGCSQLMT